MRRPTTQMCQQIFALAFSNPTAADDGNLVQFNLTDPADVEMKLDNLTDEEMEQLLKQAYRINNQLKNELDRKEREEAIHGSTRLTSQSGINIHLPINLLMLKHRLTKRYLLTYMSVKHAPLYDLVLRWYI